MYSGVYKIKCIVDDKIYIGSSMNIEKRWDTHIKSLRANKHRNPHLQNSFNKYGEKSFIFGIIEYCNLDDILIREQFYLDLYRPYDRYRGFNNCKKTYRLQAHCRVKSKNV